MSRERKEEEGKTNGGPKHGRGPFEMIAQLAALWRVGCYAGVMLAGAWCP
jgi:hypothetical protein